MIRSPGFRSLAAAAAVAAGLATPLSSLGHGFAHARAAHTPARDHHHLDADRSADTIRNGMLLSGGHGEDHSHSRVDLAPTKKLVHWGPAIAPAVVIALEEILEQTSPVAQPLRRPGPAPPGEPPPRLRAPPLI